MSPRIPTSDSHSPRKSDALACTRLLLLPKYLRKTSTSLANLWKVSEGTVRRWRKQAESLIDEDSPDLREKYNVPEERIAKLKEVLADPHRENEEGETVAIRQKPKETHCPKNAFRILADTIRNRLRTFDQAIRRESVPRAKRFQIGNLPRVYL